MNDHTSHGRTCHPRQALAESHDVNFTPGTLGVNVHDLLTPGTLQSLGQDTTAHWQTAAIMDDLSPLAPLEISDAPPLAPESSPQPPAGEKGGACSAARRSNATAPSWRRKAVLAPAFLAL